MLLRSGFWIFLFAVILLMTWSYLFFIDHSGQTKWGFPKWIIGFLILSFVYSTAVYFFSKYYWTESEIE